MLKIKDKKGKLIAVLKDGENEPTIVAEPDKKTEEKSSEETKEESSDATV